jgi:hypothetical protein
MSSQTLCVCSALNFPILDLHLKPINIKADEVGRIANYVLQNIRVESSGVQLSVQRIIKYVRRNTGPNQINMMIN